MEPETNNEQVVFQKTSGGRVGPVIGSIIIILIIILGGAYYFKTLKSNIETDKNVKPENLLYEVEVEIENLNTDDIDEDLDQIEAEIEAEIDASFN
jgi:hypothetical protein